MIQNKAMLVDLTIRQWTATKHDKNASADVEAKHSAHDAGRYNKRLIDKAHLAPINQAANKLREFHYFRTLPWSDRGQRLLPSELFMDYRQELSEHKTTFQKAVSNFVKVYPSLVQGARVRLNTLFQPLDYPSDTDLFKLFDIEIEFMPIPDGRDFRIDVSRETYDELHAQITDSIRARQASAVANCWVRIKEVVLRIAEQCEKENGVIRASLMENAVDLVTVLGALNITNDPGITEAEDVIRNQLISNIDSLRAFPLSRARVAAAARDLLSKIPEV